MCELDRWRVRCFEFFQKCLKFVQERDDTSSATDFQGSLYETINIFRERKRCVSQCIWNEHETYSFKSKVVGRWNLMCDLNSNVEEFCQKCLKIVQERDDKSSATDFRESLYGTINIFRERKRCVLQCIWNEHETYSFRGKTVVGRWNFSVWFELERWRVLSKMSKNCAGT